jgi:hypothetical protein
MAASYCVFFSVFVESVLVELDEDGPFGLFGSFTSELFEVVLVLDSTVVLGAGVASGAGAAAGVAGGAVAGAGVSTTVGAGGVCWHPVAARPKATKAEAEIHFWK